MDSPKINELVVYRKRREPTLGIVLSLDGDAVSLFSEDGKRYPVEGKKLVLRTFMSVSPDLADPEKKLEMRRWRRELEEKKASVDVETLWECVVGERETVSFGEIFDLYSGAGGSFRFREAFAFLGGGQKHRLPGKDRGRLRGPLEGGGLANPSRGGAEGRERKKKGGRGGLGSLGPGRRGSRFGRRGTSGVSGDDRALPGGPRRLRAREGSQGVSPRRGDSRKSRRPWSFS